MYLKSIKAYGFKSFADKTEINFGPNINGIVGPNGSGKSNVVDAVKWVLGEQSIKSLRGETSTDIIFSGSKSRKPLNSASVTLVFDNTDFYLPIQYTEVSVKRVMYRSGENEYYLNNEKCRLKDITNLLTDSGADKESFNIIGQGKIDEILSTKPEERRLIFESAAGVLKYKKRKIEALRKLERTNSNIDRVNDIINEIENNIIPLERQSRDATKYLEYKEQLTDLEISLIAHDIGYYNHQTKDLQEKIDTLKDELVTLSSNHSSYDIELLEKKDKVKSLEVEINGHQSTLLEITKSIEKIDSNIKLFKERLKYNEDNNLDNTNKLLALKEQTLKLELDINNAKNNLETLKTNLNIALDNTDKTRKKYEEIIATKQKLNNQIEHNNREITNIKYKINLLETNLQNDTNLPNSIRNILNNTRFTGVHNVIGKLIDVENTYKVAISIALGGASNYLVVDNTHIAKELVYYLKDNKLGRATFFPLDTIKPRYIDETFLNKIKNINGFIGIASSLVTYDPLYQNIINNQLGNIIVTDTIDTANTISNLVLKRYKIVTLDGQQVNIGGSITGGSLNSNQSLLKDKYELETKKLDLNKLINNNEELEINLTNINKSLEQLDKTKILISNEVLNIKEEINRQEQSLEVLLTNKTNQEREIKDLETISNNSANNELENMVNMYYSAITNRDNIVSIIEKLQTTKTNLEENIQEIEALTKQDNINISNKEKKLKELEIKLNTTNIKLDNLLINLGEEYNLTYEAATRKYKLEIEEDIARTTIKELKNSIKALGYVNVEAIEEYKKAKERYDFLTNQREDLKQAEDTLLEIINEMDTIMIAKFQETFEKIRIEFKKVFKEMFHGGDAELVLTDPANLLETGIEIQAVPSGKSLKSISLLSGGEKTFTAISLLFAILNVRPVPFCLLDEVEAALDDANVESFGNYLYKYRDTTQFILITHKKKTMEFADILYGITMQESGISKLVSVKLADIEE